MTLPSAEVRPTQISKYNTALQVGLIASTLLQSVYPLIVPATALTVLQYTTGMTTIWSGLSYLNGAGAVDLAKTSLRKSKNKRGGSIHR